MVRYCRSMIEDTNDDYTLFEIKKIVKPTPKKDKVKKFIKTYN